jgi:branched-chain amino acid aminotransferase
MAITSPEVWLDGALVPLGDARLPLMSHAAQRGSLVFDVGSFGRSARGPALFRARDHISRFRRSAALVGLEIAYEEDTLLRAATSVVVASGCPSGFVRWSAFFAASEPDLIVESGAAHVAVAVQSGQDRGPPYGQDPPRKSAIRVAVFDDARKAPREVFPPEAKASGAYLGPMLARRRAIAVGADDVILLDRDGGLAEGPVSNVFVVVSGELWTPPLGRILPGITRDTVLTLARSERIPIHEACVDLDMLLRADEAFLTSTSAPIAPIGWVNGAALGGAPGVVGVVGPITSRLTTRISAARRGEDPEHAAWLTYVASG